FVLLFLNHTPTPAISTLSLHDALPICRWRHAVTLAIYLFPREGELKVLRWDDGSIDLEHGVIHIHRAWDRRAKAIKSTKTGHSRDRKSTRLNSSHVKISYAVFCLKKKK